MSSWCWFWVTCANVSEPVKLLLILEYLIPKMRVNHFGAYSTAPHIESYCNWCATIGLLILIGFTAFLCPIGGKLASRAIRQKWHIFGWFMHEILLTNAFTSSHVVLLFRWFLHVQNHFLSSKIVLLDNLWSQTKLRNVVHNPCGCCLKHLKSDDWLKWRKINSTVLAMLSSPKPSDAPDDSNTSLTRAAGLKEHKSTLQSMENRKCETQPRVSTLAAPSAREQSALPQPCHLI